MPRFSSPLFSADAAVTLSPMPTPPAAAFIFDAIIAAAIAIAFVSPFSFRHRHYAADISFVFSLDAAISPIGLRCRRWPRFRFRLRRWLFAFILRFDAAGH
jgi:hypothetical protein